MPDSEEVRWHYWEKQLAKARREGVIEGLRIARELVEQDPFNFFEVIRDEIDKRMREEKP